MTRMTRTNTVLPALAVFLLAGAVPASAQTAKPRDEQRQAQPTETRRANHNTRSAVRIDQTRQGERALMFVNAKVAIGATVKNPNEDDVGEIQDFIVDRGSGKIRFAVVQSGAFLGIGGKSFAVPYGELNWTPNTKSFYGRMTPEQVERQVEFTPENWDTLEETTWMDRFQDWATPENTRDEWENITLDGSDSMTEIRGRITTVERINEGTPSERIRLTIQPQNGGSEQIILGPSWFVMGHDAAPLRGDTYVVKGVRRGSNFVVISAGPNGSELNLRDENGRTAWDDGHNKRDDRTTADRNDNRGADRDRTSDRDRMNDRTAANRENRLPRYVMLSDLIGADAQARGAESGEIQTAVIESGSGRIAFLGFDPNENFLGIGDGVTLVPWSITSIDRDLNVSIDATTDVMGSAAQMPDEMSKLNDRDTRVAIYRAYKVEPADFIGGDSKQLSVKEQANSGDAWGKDSLIAKSLADGRKVEFRGTIASINKESIMSGAPEATVLTIRMESGGTEKVIVAPAWYTDQQKLRFAVGDTVKVKGRTAVIREQTHTAAWSIEHNGETTTLWNDKNPAWAK